MWIVLHFVKRPFRSKKWLILILFSMILCLLHFQLIPSWSGAYNEDCYLSGVKKQELGYLLTNVITACKEFNLTYWLDYGTLLGAVRYGDIIPWDGDGDISIMHPGHRYDAGPWIEFLGRKDIHANMMVATYKSMTVDIMRWKKFVNRDKKTYLSKYYPADSKDSFIVKVNSKFESFPYSWIEPRSLVKFHGIQAHIPNKVNELLRKRYPLSLNFKTPYKWKCWLPFWTSNTHLNT